MSEAKADTRRASAAAKAIFDGRNASDPATVLVTLEHAVATVLLALHGADPAKAAAMLNEGLVPGVESRLAMFGAKFEGKA